MTDPTPTPAHECRHQHVPTPAQEPALSDAIPLVPKAWLDEEFKERDEARARLAEVEAERDDLRERAEHHRDERDEARAERDRLERDLATADHTHGQLCADLTEARERAGTLGARLTEAYERERRLRRLADSWLLSGVPAAPAGQQVASAILLILGEPVAAGPATPPAQTAQDATTGAAGPSGHPDTAEGATGPMTDAQIRACESDLDEADAAREVLDQDDARDAAIWVGRALLAEVRRQRAASATAAQADGALRPCAWPGCPRTLDMQAQMGDGPHEPGWVRILNTALLCPTHAAARHTPRRIDYRVECGCGWATGADVPTLGAMLYAWQRHAARQPASGSDATRVQPGLVWRCVSALAPVVLDAIRCIPPGPRAGRGSQLDGATVREALRDAYVALRTGVQMVEAERSAALDATRVTAARELLNLINEFGNLRAFQGARPANQRGDLDARTAAAADAIGARVEALTAATARVTPDGRPRRAPQQPAEDDEPEHSPATGAAWMDGEGEARGECSCGYVARGCDVEHADEVLDLHIRAEEAADRG
jgi:hypothetical protein